MARKRKGGSLCDLRQVSCPLWAWVSPLAAANETLDCVVSEGPPDPDAFGFLLQATETSVWLTLEAIVLVRFNFEKTWGVVLVQLSARFLFEGGRQWLWAPFVIFGSSISLPICCGGRARSKVWVAMRTKGQEVGEHPWDGCDNSVKILRQGMEKGLWEVTGHLPSSAI